MSTHLETVLGSTFGIKPMKPHLEITEENMAALQAFGTTHNEPIVMVNLMQVRATACYEDARGEKPFNGRVGSMGRTESRCNSASSRYRDPRHRLLGTGE